MKKITFLKEKSLSDLRRDILRNLHVYRDGNFDDLLSDPLFTFEGKFDVDYQALEKITCTGGDHREAFCCNQMYSVLGHISPYLARDLRLWVHITHTYLLPYVRQRWPIPVEDDAKAVKHIETHFFGTASRGVERDNAASRLWWMAFLCSRVDGLSLEDALNSFLYSYDVRANIMERPTTAQSVRVFSCVIRKLHASWNSDKKLFERERFRAVMKGLNVHGGVQLIDLMNDEQINELIENFSA